MRRSFSRMIQEKERRWSEIKVTAGGRRGDERPLATVQVKRSDLRKRENTAINLYICCYVSKFEIGRLKYKRRYPPEESQREAKPKQRTSNHGRFFFFFSFEVALLAAENQLALTMRRSLTLRDVAA